MTSASAGDDLVADLVLEAGGVKGIAISGAVSTLARQGYTFRRIAGTSAGAITGAVLAALQHAGEPLERGEDVARSLKYARFRDRGTIGRLLGPLGWLVDGFSLALDSGIYEGAYLHDWLLGVLADLGVSTFGDLREHDAASALPPEHAYRLVVFASDLSQQRLVRLPWDYPDYGLDPDEMRVADAVRASASIPFFFEPVTMRGSRGVSTLVDGALLSNYPIAVFDRTDGLPARWPTLGVRVTSVIGDPTIVEPVDGPLSLALALVETALTACQSQHIDNPANVARSIFVDTSGIASTDFGITPDQRDQLLEAGSRATERFLRDWDFAHWQQQWDES
ncbi:MAG: patatin-like phospholipase family protein [Nocardioidaceae bacterium]|nr:patatin-like phospholipase family protein [Nocardioidaceae bacterium]